MPSNATVRGKIQEEKSDRQVKVSQYPQSSIKGKAGLFLDTWVSRVYRGCLTIPFIGSTKFGSCLVEFVRFLTPHNGETLATVVIDIFENLEINK